MELWDVYNINREKTGKVIDRHGCEILQDGEYHLVTEAIIINSKQEILMSKRAEFKTKYPLMWECNGGSVKSGEDTLQAILRELKEELGISLNENEAIFYKTIRDDKAKDFKDIWIFRKDIDLKELSFTDNEVIEAKWVSIKEFEKMRKNNDIVPTIDFDEKELKNIINKIHNNCNFDDIDDVIVRNIQKKDIPSVVDIQIEGWKTAYKGIINDSYLKSMNKDERIEKRKKDYKEYRFIVAEYNNEIIGFCRYIDNNKNTSDIDNIDCELIALYVKPSLKYNGIGTKLFEYVKEEFRNKNKRKMIIWCLKDNEASKRFYTRLGGKIIKERKIEIGEEEYLEVGFVYDI